MWGCDYILLENERRFQVCCSVCRVHTDAFQSDVQGGSRIWKGGFVHWLIQELSLGGAPWRARGREPITGVWGQSPQRSLGAEALVGGQGGEAPLQLKAF